MSSNPILFILFVTLLRLHVALGDFYADVLVTPSAAIFDFGPCMSIEELEGKVIQTAAGQASVLRIAFPPGVSDHKIISVSCGVMRAYPGAEDPPRIYEHVALAGQVSFYGGAALCYWMNNGGSAADVQGFVTASVTLVRSVCEKMAGPAEMVQPAAAT